MHEDLHFFVLVFSGRNCQWSDGVVDRECLVSEISGRGGLLACAEAVQQENFKAANALVKQISMLDAAHGGPMRKVVGYFTKTIARRIYCRCPRPGSDRAALDLPALDDLLHVHFYKSCPYLKFAHFTANQAILEPFTSCRLVHVIDFGLRPPSFCLTGIGPPQADHSDALQQVGWKLAMLVKNIGIEFHFHGFVATSLANLKPRMLLELESGNKGDHGDDGEEEAVAVNSVMELHRLLARSGAMEKGVGDGARLAIADRNGGGRGGEPQREDLPEAVHRSAALLLEHVRLAGERRSGDGGGGVPGATDLQRGSVREDGAARDAGAAAMADGKGWLRASTLGIQRLQADEHAPRSLHRRRGVSGGGGGRLPHPRLAHPTRERGRWDQIDIKI
ncbi:hypothetical protein Cni_G14606 [Canna indica]|uniref:DELLA protein n=1 Tax=Canna indica TaxID=4628 RepID=A0AAQ3KCC2_9LILI|nr:hypothetical protein Cni_G14606 [Canna indica]